MYRNETEKQAGNEQDRRVIARFESWLRSRGYEPERDPFMPFAGDDETDEAISTEQLVREYLDDRPLEHANWQELLCHARQSRQVIPIWGDSGCGLALAG